MRVYQDLVFRNIRSLLANNFPVIASIAAGKDWDWLIRGFIRDYRSQTPHFPLLPIEFLRFLEQLENNAASAGQHFISQYPFITELAHYEWVELDVQIAPTPEIPVVRRKIGFDEHLALNPTAHVLAYCWPVHQIGPNFLPRNRPQTPTFLAVFLNTDCQVEFMSLTPLAALLLENIELRSASLSEHISILADQYGALAPDRLTGATTDLIEQLLLKGLIFSKSEKLLAKP